MINHILYLLHCQSEHRVAAAGKGERSEFVVIGSKTVEVHQSVIISLMQQTPAGRYNPAPNWWDTVVLLTLLCYKHHIHNECIFSKRNNGTRVEVCFVCFCEKVKLCSGRLCQRSLQSDIRGRSVFSPDH